jgi:hypothetical protein
LRAGPPIPRADTEGARPVKLTPDPAEIPAGAVLLTKHCRACGESFRAVLNVQTRVDHRCPSAVSGAVWVVTEPKEAQR